MRKIKVRIETDVTLLVDEEADMEQIINEMDYVFTASYGSCADVIDMEITDWDYR
jgi:hypothetical protein